MTSFLETVFPALTEKRAKLDVVGTWVCLPRCVPQTTCSDTEESAEGMGEQTREIQIGTHLPTSRALAGNEGLRHCPESNCTDRQDSLYI